MAGPSLREGSPRGRASAGTISAVTSGAVTGIPAIVALLALGLVLRFIIAYVLFPGSGFPNDLGAFQAWGNDIAKHGPIGFYDRQSFIDYPPVYLLLLGAVSLFTSGSIGEGVKLVPMLADLGLAAVVWQMAQELGVNRRRAFLAALIVLVNPVTWFNSSIWGQADAVGSILLLLGLRELQKDRRETASALAVLAALTKMQLGILGFVVGLVVLRRSLLPKTGERQPERVLSSLGAGLLTGALVCLPFTGLDFGGAVQRIGTGAGLLTVAAGLVAGVGVFSLGRRYLPLAAAARRTQASALLGIATVVAFSGMVFDSIASHMLSTFGEYPYLTLNAYNPWALVADGVNAMDRTHAWLHDAPWTDAKSGATGTGYVIGPFSGEAVALVVAVVALVVVAAFAARRWTRGNEGTGGPGTAQAAIGSRARAIRAAAAELGGLWGASLVVAAVVAGVVVASLSGQLYAVTLGDGLLVAILLGVGLWAAWHDDAQSLLVALTIMAIAFFVVPTRAHERYLFPFFGLGAVLMAVSWRWSLTYAVLAVVNSANLLAVLVQYQGIPAGDGSLAQTLNDWGTGLLNTQWQGGIIWPIWVCGASTGLAMAWALLQLRPRAVAALNREVDRAALEPESAILWSTIPLYPAQAAGDGWYGEPPLDAASAAAPASLPGAAPAPATGLMATAPLAAEGSGYAPGGVYDFDYTEEEAGWVDESGYLEEPDRPLYVPAWVMRLWHRLARPSTHPDRSASIDSEPRGRLDKLDLWVVVALAVVILSMRVYRLDEPQQMHFDEVYHARTATEFLQDWRYGIPYNLPGGYVYEWTHPHVAKYGIAAGITLFSDDKVTATGALDSSVKDILVQPRTAASPLADPNNPDAQNTDARYGDRIFVATGSEVRVYDLETRALVGQYGIPGAAAFSDIGSTGLLYVGSSDGRVYTIDTTNLDDVRLGNSNAIAPPKQMAVNTGLSIARLYAGTAPYLLAADATGNMVSIDLSKNGGTVVASGLVPGVADFSDLGVGPSTLVKKPAASQSATPTDTPSSSPTDTPSSSATDTASSGPTATAPLAEVQALATALGLDQAVVQSALDQVAAVGLPQALDFGPLSSGQISAVQTLITQGLAPDIAVQSGTPQVMVAYQKGIGFVNASTLVITSTLPTDAPATSIAINYSGLQGTSISGSQSSYVTAGDSLVLIHIDQTTTPWTVTMESNQILKKMPGAVTQVVFDRATRVAQVLGRTPDGSGWTVYAIETNGNAVFSDARLPFQPVAIGLDSSPMMPDTDHEQVLAVAPDGSMATVDVGQFAFSWRIIGVLFGALMAVCLYLLARLLFKRRSIGLLVALFSMTDGMLFVQSRIAMNDTYVGGFLLLAYLLFALLWLDVWKSRVAFWLGMPVIGVILGFALASKWVAMYAIASIGILILLRSALGRLIAILGLVGGTGVLGWMAIGEMVTEPNTGNPAAVVFLIGLAPFVAIGGFVWAMSVRATADRALIGVVTAIVVAGLVGAGLTMSPGTLQNGAPNYTFFVIILAITALAAAANAYHPIAWTREELWFAIGAPVVIGVLAALDGVLRGNGLALAVGAAGIAGGPAIAAAFWFAGTLGFGPLAPPPGPDDPGRFADPPAPAPKGWLRLGTGFGLPAAWMAACVLILPVVIYVMLYIPWSMPWQPQTDATGQLPAIACWHTDPATGVCDNAWPTGHTGQNLWNLTISMYNYHNDLRQPHAASSPWWAWPMDLKPVWFENQTYANDLGTMIYDGGNPAIWWMSIFAMAFVTWQAFKRRSLGLTLVVVAFFWQWLSWARIDRASFQYHFYTALPFFLLALAYLLAELWHGPSRRTWLLARVAGAGALIFPAATWVLKYPLCGLARVSPGDYWGNTICGNGTGDVRVETRMLEIAIVLVVALIALALILWRLERRQNAGQEDRFWILQLLLPVGVAGALLGWFGTNGSHDTVFQAALPSDGIALVLLPVLAVMAFIVLTARNPRRFVLGACAAVIVTFLALYPNLSALPLPNKIINVYEALLPTWFYGFQFSVNLQEAASVQLFGTWSILLTMVALFVAGFFAWAAWERRVVVGYRRWMRLSGDAAAAAGADSAAEAGTETEADAGAEATAGSEATGRESAVTGDVAGPTDGPAPERSRKDKPGS